ncbi:hypothetical protein JCM11491_001124 [Sporobolomyces phaffii]
MSDAQAGDEPRYPSTLAPAAYYSGLADRITDNLLPVFSRLFSLASTRTVLELASGDGLHSLVYSTAFPNLTFQPTECDTFNRNRIDETCRPVRANGGRGVEEAGTLDVMQESDWTELARSRTQSVGAQSSHFDLVIGHNFLHMIRFPEGPRSIFANLLKHDLVSRSHGLIAFYGPFKHDGGFYSTGDESFDKEISSRPSSYPLGLRSVDALARIAAEEGFEHLEKVAMPKGNWVLIYKVRGGEHSRLQWT